MPAWKLSLLRTSLLQTASTVTSVYIINNVCYCIFPLWLPVVVIWTPYCPWVCTAICQQSVLSVSYLVNKLCQEIHILCLHSSPLQWQFDRTSWYNIVSWLSWTLPKQSQLSVEDPCQWRGGDTGINKYTLAYKCIMQCIFTNYGGCA